MPVEEVSGFLGDEMIAETKPLTSGAFGVCEWRPQDVSGYTARLTVGPVSHYEVLKSRRATPVTGIGDEAWTTHTDGATGDYDIGVKTGDRHVLIFFTSGQDFEKAKQMATRIVEELG